MNSMLPIFGMIMGLVITCGVIAGGLELIRGPLGQALARRLQGRDAGGEREIRQDVAELRDQVDGLRAALEETNERLDFTERLLAQVPQPERLPER
jgi:hypothetical protein